MEYFVFLLSAGDGDGGGYGGRLYFLSIPLDAWDWTADTPIPLR